MDGLVEDDHRGANAGQRDVQAAAGDGGLQLLGEVLQVGIGGVSQELEEVVVEAVGMRAVHDEVRDGEHLEQETGPLALLGAVPQQALCVDHHHLADGVERRPHAHRAGLLGGGGLEHLLPHEERVVQCVGFSLPGVAKDGHHFQQTIPLTAQFLHKRSFILYLEKTGEHVDRTFTTANLPRMH